MNTQAVEQFKEEHPNEYKDAFQHVLEAADVVNTISSLKSKTCPGCNKPSAFFPNEEKTCWRCVSALEFFARPDDKVDALERSPVLERTHALERSPVLERTEALERSPVLERTQNRNICDIFGSLKVNADF